MPPASSTSRAIADAGLEPARDPADPRDPDPAVAAAAARAARPRARRRAALPSRDGRGAARASRRERRRGSASGAAAARQSRSPARGEPRPLRLPAARVARARRLARHAAAAALAGLHARRVATLAIAIGANTALFALVDAVVLKPLPYPEPERLVAIVEHARGSRSSIAPANIADYRVGALESLAAWHFTEMDLSDGGRPETLFAHAVTHDFFAVLGTGPMLGRAFLPEEDREGGARKS